MVANKIRTFPNMENEAWLSIEKIIAKCGKVLHNNQENLTFLLSLCVVYHIFISCKIYMTASKCCGFIVLLCFKQ